jgi:hypothetical protein
MCPEPVEGLGAHPSSGSDQSVRTITNAASEPSSAPP